MESRIHGKSKREALWEVRIQTCAQSGLSVKAFCQREGIALSISTGTRSD